MKITIYIDTNKLTIDEFLPYSEQHIFEVIKDINYVMELIKKKNSKTSLKNITNNLKKLEEEYLETNKMKV